MKRARWYGSEDRISRNFFFFLWSKSLIGDFASVCGKYLKVLRFIGFR